MSRPPEFPAEDKIRIVLSVLASELTMATPPINRTVTSATIRAASSMGRADVKMRTLRNLLSAQSKPSGV
jgi:hypothetical protein